MEKKERYARYKHSMGFSAWEIGSYKDQSFAIVVNDGPNGLRKPACNDFNDQSNVIKTICLPSISALACSFDKKSCYEDGYILSQECISNGTNILLAPGVNIKHNIFCGRNYEYFSEDPYHAGILAASYINGLEENGVGTCIKHFAVNSQEHARFINSSEVSLRALNEIYLRNFKYALKYSSPTSIMTSYNRVNGEYVNESTYLIQDKIRKEYNYKGFICSDWCAVSDKGLTIKTGLNIEMPISSRTNEFLDKEYQTVFTDEDLINRDNELYSAIKKFKNRRTVDLFDLEKAHKKAIELANGTIVLAKNESNFLPLNKNEKVLILGNYALNPYFVGNGSGWVDAYKKISFIDVLKENNIDFTYEQCFDNEKVLISKEQLLEYKNKFDKVILFIGRTPEQDAEGLDRNSLLLKDNQLTIYNNVKEIFDNFMSIIITGSVVALKDIYNSSKAVLISYFNGEGQAESLFNVLYGLYNPSGRLCETWIDDISQNPYMERYLERNDYYTYCDDDIYVGYRYYDLNDNGFILPFGYGLSYTKFDISLNDYFVDKEKISININVKNIGKYDGMEVVQVYVGKKDSSIYRPIKELKGFEKVFVKANESANINVILNIDDLTSYREEDDSFALEEGKYQIYICRNAKEIIDIFEIELEGEKFAPHKEPIKLVRKEIAKDYTFNTPGGALLYNQYFRDFIKEKGIPFDDLDNFEKNFWNIDSCPLRDIIGRLGFTFELMEELINYLNSKPHDLSKYINYDHLIKEYLK